MPPGCHVKPEQFFNLIFGYYDQVLIAKTVVATGTTCVLDSDAPPSGEVWVITSVGGSDNSRQSTYGEIGIMEGGINKRNLYPLAPVGVSWTLGTRTMIILQAGDKVRLRLGGTENGDTCEAFFHGYKMKLAQ